MKKISISNKLKRFRRRLKSKLKKKNRRKIIYNNDVKLAKELGNNISYQNQLNKWLSPNLKYILNSFEPNKYEYNDFTFDYQTGIYIIEIPEKFSLNINLNESLSFIYTITFAILSDNYKEVVIDYNRAKRIDLSAQIYLDVILVDLLKFIKKRDSYRKTKPHIKSIGGQNIFDKDIQKILFSIGSPAIINNTAHKFYDIIPYKLCVHNKEKHNINNIRRKEVDTTTLVEHVIASLKMVGKSLSPESIEDLSTVFGEILINAEEHSTLKYRYSTGYFQKIDNDSLNSAYGIYHLAIMNFGESIYEKFKSPNCTNFEILDKMKSISKNYTKNGFFTRSFHEESLWTLYALQEGITSVSTTRYKRGNGSIRFIDSFFNLKGDSNLEDKISKLSIISGNTSIIFDGKYKIQDKIIGKDLFKVMTFNESGNIEDKPDRKYVKFRKDFFPGTIITAKILITEDDL